MSISSIQPSLSNICNNLCQTYLSIDTFLCFCVLTDEISTWYVSLNNANPSDSSVCGEGKCGCSFIAPCTSLRHVIEQAHGDDIILVDGAPTQQEGKMYEFCDKNTSIIDTSSDLHKSITIRGYNGLPRIGCPYIDDADSDTNDDGGHAKVNSENLTFENQTEDNHNMTVQINNASSNCVVKMRNIELLNGKVTLTNCTLEMVNVVFTNTSLSTFGSTCHHINVTLSNITIYGRVHCDRNGMCINKLLNNITCRNVQLSVLQSVFYQTTVIVVGKQTTKILVDGCLFSNLPGVLQFLGGLHFTFSSFDAYVNISNSTFEKQVYPNRVQSVINLYDAAIWLKADIDETSNYRSRARAFVENCIFQDNERGITLVGVFHQLEILSSVFDKNIAMHAGAAMLVLINKQSQMIISKCTFRNNVAGKFRDSYPIIERSNDFQVVGSEVHLNASCCKGVIDLVGKGGALRIQRGNTIITQCDFMNNTARLLGGSVFVDIDGNVTTTDCYFENTPFHQHALQGDIMYSDGFLTVSQVTFKVKTAINGLSIFRHSGDHWELDIRNVAVECPMGYDLRTTNSSAYGVTPIGLRRSYKLDQLSYFCESCPRNKYSLDNGYLNYTMVFNDFAYFTLLINGSEPSPQYTGNYIHHKIQCLNCPYGGHCVQGITSVANFWGYSEGEVVKFQHCPKGYCCSTPECPSIDSCSSHRQGTLCGRCSEGYSEALFSPHCIPNDKCDRMWIYPFSTGVGLIYAIFLLFQADLQQFLFSKPLGLGRLVKKFGNKKPKLSYMNGLVKSEKLDGTQVKFIPNGGELFKPNCSSSTSATNHNSNELENSPSKTDNRGFGSGLLVIMFYYFQDALLLNVKTVYVREESKGQQLMKSVLSGIFKFQLDLFELLEEVCMSPGMTVVPKTLAKALIVPYVIALFIVMYLIYSTLQMLNSSTSSINASGHLQNDIDSAETTNGKSFGTRFASGFILAVMFMFQKLGTTTFILLNCVPVKSQMVLFIDGTVTCYQNWQYIVIAYATVCVTPFFVVLLVGPSLLKKRVISLPEFFFSCLFPLPFLFIWLIKVIYRCITKPTPHPELRSGSVGAVLKILQGPFKDNSLGLCWSGVLIGRRLVLILLFTFVTDTLIRLLCMLLACFMILLHHVHIKPYKDPRGNLAGTISASALVVLGSINLVRAGFEAAEYTPTGPNAYLIKVFAEIENILLLWGPMCVMFFIVLVFVYRLLALMEGCMCCHGNINTSTNNNSAALEVEET